MLIYFNILLNILICVIYMLITLFHLRMDSNRDEEVLEVFEDWERQERAKDEILPTDNSTLMQTGSDEEILEAHYEWGRDNRGRGMNFWQWMIPLHM